MEMRLTENLNQLRQPVGNRFEIFIGPVPGPALPTWTKVNREGPWPFRPSAWFFHSLACVGCFSLLVLFELGVFRVPAEFAFGLLSRGDQLRWVAGTPRLFDDRNFLSRHFLAHGDDFAHGIAVAIAQIIEALLARLHGEDVGFSQIDDM